MPSLHAGKMGRLDIKWEVKKRKRKKKRQKQALVFLIAYLEVIMMQKMCIS